MCIKHSNNLQTHIDSNITVIFVHENTPASTVITRVNATDADIGVNGQIRYNILNSSLTLPFRINNTSGEIRVVGNIDFEVTQMFILRVQASDSGTPIRSATRDYTVNITNMNDNSPQFAAPTYLPAQLAGHETSARYLTAHVKYVRNSICQVFETICHTVHQYTLMSVNSVYIAIKAEC